MKSFQVWTIALLAGLSIMGSVMAGSADNLQIEVRVNVAGTTDLQWATRVGTTTVLGVGTIETTAPVSVDDKTDLSAGVNDKATWTIANPLLGEVRGTHAAGTDPTIDFLLDNIGNKKVNVACIIPTAATADSAAFPWTLGAAAATSIFALEIRSSDSGIGGTGGTPAIAGTITPAAYTPLAVGATQALVTDFKRFENHLEIDLQYNVPLDVTANNEFDIDHVTTITVTGTAP